MNMTVCTRILLVAILVTQMTSLVLAKSLAKRYLQETRHLPQTYIQVSATPCQDAGHRNGCCTNSCQIGYLNCYCDLTCYRYGDCCEDIRDINCLPPDETTSCNDLPLLANGVITYHPLPNPKSPGTIASHTCNANYTLVGNSNRLCQSDATWSGSEPECRKTCNELPALSHGTISFEPNHPSSRKVLRTVATYSCNEGYSLSVHENAKRVCQQSGQWSGVAPVCTVVSCQVAFTGGCCSSGFCYIGSVASGQCSCSAECFTNEYIKCCSDIECPRHTCAEAGVDNGCCNWDDEVNGCYVPDNRCFCDEECRNAMDCCSDVNSTRMCFSKSARQLLADQSVKTRPYSQAQMASRPREDQNQKSADNQAVRELASELRSMSRAQELSNEQQRAEWEAILRELLEIQKNN